MLKLHVYGKRAGSCAAKCRQDMHQVASLPAYCREHGKRDIDEAWVDLVLRGKGWVRRAGRGVEALDGYYPDIMAGDRLAVQWQPPGARLVIS